jgi:hypothetical protein
LLEIYYLFSGPLNGMYESLLQGLWFFILAYNMRFFPFYRCLEIVLLCAVSYAKNNIHIMSVLTIGMLAVHPYYDSYMRQYMAV